MRQAGERLLAALAVILYINDDPHPLFAVAVGGEVRKVLQRIKGLTMLADQDTEVLTPQVEGYLVYGGKLFDLDVQLHRREHALQKGLGSTYRVTLGFIRLGSLAGFLLRRFSGGGHLGFLQRHAHAGRLSAQQSEQPFAGFVQHFIFNLFPVDAKLGDGGVDRLSNRFACFLNSRHKSTRPSLRRRCGWTV